LFIDLQKGGLTIRQSDKDIITKKVGQLEMAEKKINDAVKVLRTLVNLQNFVKSFGQVKFGGSQMSGQKTLSLDRVMSNQELLQYLSTNAGDYESCVHKNIDFLNSGTLEILKSYNDLLLTLTTEKGNKQYQSL